MEDEDDKNFRQNIPSPSPDQEAIADACVTELTETNSDSSAITADCSKDFSLHNVDSAPGSSTVWTDEKHRLYLDSLEASFVNQLHHSIALRGCLQDIWGSYSSTMPTNSCNSSQQFIVLQDGSWPKINPKMNKPQLKSTSNSHFIQKNLWQCHFTSKGKRHIAACYDQEHGASSRERVHAGGNSLVCCGLARSSQHPECSPCHQNSVDIVTDLLVSGSAASVSRIFLQCDAANHYGNHVMAQVCYLEVSDQNFADENHREESSSTSTVKRLRTVGPDATSNDQVVPFGYSNTSKISSTSQSSSEREQVHKELLSENPDHFVYSKSNLNYFLRES